MTFRWSGAVAYDDQQARERLQGYFEAIGYQCVQREPDLMLQRGSFWRGLISAAPRHIWMRILARAQPWGVHTLVDVEFQILQRGRSLQALDAELLVEEARQMVRYLQEGDADFEKLQQLNQRAIRTARRALITTLVIVAALALPVGLALAGMRVPSALAPVIGGAIGGLIAGFLFRHLTRRRR